MKKTAFITGAGGYIGGTIARTLAAGGLQVAVCDILQERAEQTVQMIRADGGTAIGLVLDVTDPSAVDAAVQKTADAFGSLDICVHAAGGSARVAGPEVHTSLLVDREDFVIDAVLKINLYGALYVSRAAARQMIRQGSGGRIINIASVVGVNGLRKSAEYAAAKGGVIAATKALAKEVGAYHITANTVSPGVVVRPGENDAKAESTNFLGERCTAQDIADAVAFLASEQAHFITGHNLVVDGGRSLAMRGSELK